MTKPKQPKASSDPSRADSKAKRLIAHLPPGTHVACINCRQGHRRCNGSAPCSDCVRLGIEDQCVYLPPGRKGRKPKPRPGAPLLAEAQTVIPARRSPTLTRAKAESARAAQRQQQQLRLQALGKSSALLTPPVDSGDASVVHFSYSESTQDVISALERELADFEASYSRFAPVPLSPEGYYDNTAAVGVVQQQQSRVPSVSTFSESSRVPSAWNSPAVGYVPLVPCDPSRRPSIVHDGHVMVYDGRMQIDSSMPTPPPSRRTSETDSPCVGQAVVQYPSSALLHAVPLSNDGQCASTSNSSGQPFAERLPNYGDASCGATYYQSLQNYDGPAVANNEYVGW